MVVALDIGVLVCQLNIDVSTWAYQLGIDVMASINVSDNYQCSDGHGHTSGIWDFQWPEGICTPDVGVLHGWPISSSSDIMALPQDTKLCIDCSFVRIMGVVEMTACMCQHLYPWAAYVSDCSIGGGAPMCLARSLPK